MNYEQYNRLYLEILSKETQTAPYDNPDFLEYLELNQKRSERWDKKGEIIDALEQEIKSIQEQQKWILITEPWCGDAAHSVPFIAKLAQLNSNIELDIQLRDSDSEIDSYLTNGSKSIPLLIVRDQQNQDLFVWGPRPDKAQELHLANLKTDKSLAERKIELQKWYNQDKGRALQEELLICFQDILQNSVVKLTR